MDPIVSHNQMNEREFFLSLHCYCAIVLGNGVSDTAIVPMVKVKRVNIEKWSTTVPVVRVSVYYCTRGE